MKKLIFSLLIVLGAVSASAQSGKVFMAGEIGITHKARGGANGTTWSVLPTVGYFVSNSTAIATKVGYSQTTGSGITTTKEFVVAPFVRQIFLKGDVGALFVDAGLDLAFGKQGSVNTTSIGAGLTPGAIVNIGNGFALTATFGHFGYIHDQTKVNDEKTNINTYNFGLNLDRSTVGVMYTF